MRRSGVETASDLAEIKPIPVAPDSDGQTGTVDARRQEGGVEKDADHPPTRRQRAVTVHTTDAAIAHSPELSAPGAGCRLTCARFLDPLLISRAQRSRMSRNR